jgi:hypothetical protein
MLKVLRVDGRTLKMLLSSQFVCIRIVSQRQCSLPAGLASPVNSLHAQGPARGWMDSALDRWVDWFGAPGCVAMIGVINGEKDGPG